MSGQVVESGADGYDGWRASRDGDSLPDVLRESVDSLYRMMRAFGLAPENAEEVVQETCCCALERVAQYRGEGSLFAWVAKIAYRLASRRRRASRRAPLPLPPEVPGRLPAPENGVVAEEERLRLEAAFDRLPAREREVLFLKAVEGMEGKEIAEILGIPLGTVWSDLARARERMRRILQPEPRSSKERGHGMS